MIESDIIQSIVLNSKIVVDTNNSVAFQLRLYNKLTKARQATARPHTFLTQSRYLFDYIIAGNNADGLIDLPQCLLPDSVRYDMKDQPTFVTVHALEYMDGASELFVDPVTWEDWELLQHNAATLEEGRLLQQISVVYSGQVIRLAMSNGARASLVVLPRNFERNDENRVWPKDATADSINHGGRYPCYRLLADTQVIIAPKPRIPQHPVQHLFQLIPTRQDYEMFDCGMIELSKVLEVELVSVPQGVMILHPNTFGRIQDEFQTTTTALGSFAVVHAVPTTWRRKTDDIVGKSNHNDDDVSVTVKIIVSTTVPENHAGEYFGIRSIGVFTCAVMSMTIVYHANSDCSSRETYGLEDLCF